MASGEPPPRLDSWPAKSPDEKLDALLPLAKTLARRMGRKLPSRLRADAESAAAIGAWEVIRKYGNLDREDVRKLAVVRIRGAIIDELRRTTWLPRHEHKRSDASVELRAEVEVGIGPTQELRLEDEQKYSGLYDAIAGLSERERHVLVELYVNGKTAWKLAEELGVSQPRVSQLRKRAVERLREAMLK